MTEPSNEFIKVINEFLIDLERTFPEYKTILKNINMVELYDFCKKKYPPQFFHILYQNDDIFQEKTEIDTEFLPGISFSKLWQSNISEKTKNTIWKYLQLILFSLVGSLDNKDVFGDTAKLFEAIPEADFYHKLQKTMAEMNTLFEQIPCSMPNENDTSTEEESSLPFNADDIQTHISSMLDGNIGKLAKEIAEEASAEWTEDVGGDSPKDMKDLFGKLLKNPQKIMNLVKSVSNKLEEKIKSGEFKESELMEEAKELMGKFKNIPGMGNIGSLFSKMGMGGGKVNMNAMENMLSRNIKNAKLKERLKQKQQSRVMEQLQKKAAEHIKQTSIEGRGGLTEEDLIHLFTSTTTNTNNGNTKPNPKKKKGKK